jgi:hypothetical protein
MPFSRLSEAIKEQSIRVKEPLRIDSIKEGITS